MSRLVARLQARSLRREMRGLERLYGADANPDEIARFQLDRLNRVWRAARSDVPYYRALAARLDLPEQWSSIEEFSESLPSSGKHTLQTEGDALFSSARAPEQWGATGGSTAEPIQIPRWNSELIATRSNAWLGRSWYGVEPDDRLFLLWGHSHLLGTGLSGWVNARRRQLADYLLGYCRHSAYDLSTEAMHRGVERILAFRPDYVLGYSVALDRMGREVGARREQLRALGLKAVIATAEGFPALDSAEYLSDVFGCPVAMEYGAVESLGIAYTHPEGGYRVFWHSYLVEAERSGARWQIRLTCLYPRSLALFRYEIGDEVELPPGTPDRVLGLIAFDRVAGRCNDYVELSDGTLVHSEAFSHAVRACRTVRGYQVIQEGDDIRLCFTADADLSEEEATGLRHRLTTIHPELGAVPWERRDELSQTTAGKTPMVLRR